MTTWIRNTRRPGRTARPRILTNNPERGSNRWGGLRAVGTAQRSVRRLMKRDLNNAQGTPPDQLKLTTMGMSQSGGASAKVMGTNTSRTRVAPGGDGRKRIRGQGVNRSLKKR